MWTDIFKIFTYAFKNDPLTTASRKDAVGAGVNQPDSIPDIRQDGSFWGGNRGMIRLRDSNDFIDLSTITNRQSRYKEYERLRNVPEIEMAMTLYADEACLGGDTKISTVLYGEKTIKWIYENLKDQEFMVYCWDETKKDFTIGWAFNPRIVKKSKTYKVITDDGKTFVATHEHQVMKSDGTMAAVGSLNKGDYLKLFSRVEADFQKTKCSHNQFPRIFTHLNGWTHERNMIEEWKGTETPNHVKDFHEISRCFAANVDITGITKITKKNQEQIKVILKKNGFSLPEMKFLNQTPRSVKVLAVVEDKREVDVFDLSVKDFRNFCGDRFVFHNCQKGDNAHVGEIICKNSDVKKELEKVAFGSQYWNLDRKVWNDAKSLFIMGDLFLEVIIDLDNPKYGVLRYQSLPQDSVYRIETVKGKLIEFQQSKEGPDYEALTRTNVTTATETENLQSKAIRFTPDQIIHMRIGDDRRTFYPYGQSLIEPARGPAHQLRLMEDSMVVYRLVRAPERRVFYIDTGTLPPNKIEAFMSRMQDLYRKKKVSNQRVGQKGASQVDEKWQPPPADEDFWIPIRPNSNTRIDTLPGAQNLGEIDDSVYFRNKLFIALGLPSDYFSTQDVQATRITLSARDSKFARMIERLQASLEDGYTELMKRHLYLMGFPEETYDDVKFKLTPPSEWRELSRAEVISSRLNSASTLKSSALMSDYDILVKFLKYTDREAKEIIARNKIQKLEDLKMQIIAQNPDLLGFGVPGDTEENKISSEPGADGASINPDDHQGQGVDQGQPLPDEQPAEAGMKPEEHGKKHSGLPEPSEEDIKKYDLEIKGYSKEQDHEDIDYSLGN